MSDPSNPARPNITNTAMALVVFAATVFGTAKLGTIGTRAANLWAAVALSAGTALLAALTWRFSRLPRWAYVASVFILAASAIASAWFWPDVASWKHVVRDSLWMHPWYFLVLMSLRPGSAGRYCYCGAWGIILGAVALAGVVPVIGFLL